MSGKDKLQLALDFVFLVAFFAVAWGFYSFGELVQLFGSKEISKEYEQRPSKSRDDLQKRKQLGSVWLVDIRERQRP